MQGAAYDPAKGEVFVVSDVLDNAAYDIAGNLYAISDSTNSIVANVTMGEEPVGVAYDSGTSEVYVANNNATSVSVISDANNAVVAALPVGSRPLGLVYDSAKAEVFVGNSGSGTISIISDAGSATTSTVPEFPTEGLLAVTFLLLSLCGLMFRGKIAKSC